MKFVFGWVVVVCINSLFSIILFGDVDVIDEFFVVIINDGYFVWKFKVDVVYYLFYM